MNTLAAAAPRLAVIGGGPAGLMAAEIASDAGIAVDLYDRMGSVGRKFLLAGKGGLNLTHSEPFDAFVRRYGVRGPDVRRWLDTFDAAALRAWVGDFGIETFVGSSGRVFPSDLKAAPLLRGWVRRLRERGVQFHMHHRWLGWDASGALRFDTAVGERTVTSRATVLALGGGSWAKLGSDGAWVVPLRAAGVDVAPLLPSNCGFDVDGGTPTTRAAVASSHIGWSAHFAARFAGAPLKPVIVHWTDASGAAQQRQGECVATATGLEGSLIYAISAPVRDAIARDGSARIQLDLTPGRAQPRLLRELSRPRKGRSLTEHLRRSVGIEGVKAGLLYELLPKTELADPVTLAARIKALPVTLLRPRPLDEAISSAGGVRLEALDDTLMLRAGADATPQGVFCAGEMLDWEAPTGGYLLTAALASGRVAGRGAVRWLQARRDDVAPTA